jgi:putative transposase
VELWQTFLRAHWGVIAGADFLTIEVWTWRGLVTFYTAFVIDLASRRVQILGSTPHPDEAFMQQWGGHSPWRMRELVAS